MKAALRQMVNDAWGRESFNPRAVGSPLELVSLEVLGRFPIRAPRHALVAGSRAAEGNVVDPSMSSCVNVLSVEIARPNDQSPAVAEAVRPRPTRPFLAVGPSWHCA